ncbi:MAG: hypothetical protein J7639_02270 [Paenibacillaceae bacterium]|nr:hypothetical protein [Paenibacillaceae bacterium]
MENEQERLAAAWRKMMPAVLHEGDEATVNADESDPSGLMITIRTAGHTGFSFDFRCRYVDDREVLVELVDADKYGRTIDERPERVQQLVEDYVRHIHECAQALQSITRA